MEEFLFALVIIIQLYAYNRPKKNSLSHSSTQRWDTWLEWGLKRSCNPSACSIHKFELMQSVKNIYICLSLSHLSVIIDECSVYFMYFIFCVCLCLCIYLDRPPSNATTSSLKRMVFLFGVTASEQFALWLHVPPPADDGVLKPIKLSHTLSQPPAHIQIAGSHIQRRTTTTTTHKKLRARK